MKHPKTFIFTTITLIAVLSACGSSTNDHTNSGLFLSAADIEIEIENAPEDQRKYIEDGIVTKAEREAAYFEFLTCMQDQGIETLSYDLRPQGGDSIEQNAGDVSPTDVDIVTNQCRSTHYTQVGVVYEFNNRLSEEQLNQILHVTEHCMTDAGHDVVEGSTLDQMNEIDRSQAATCWRSATLQVAG